jgi:hypothetical protein
MEKLKIYKNIKENNMEIHRKIGNFGNTRKIKYIKRKIYI